MGIERGRVRTPLSSSKSMTFSLTLGLAVPFKNCHKFPCFRVFFDLTVQQTQILMSTKMCYIHAIQSLLSIISYNVLALSSAVTNLPHKTLIFHDFQGPTVEFHDFPGLENEILKIYFVSFQDFHDWYKPQGKGKLQGEGRNGKKQWARGRN